MEQAITDKLAEAEAMQDPEDMEAAKVKAEEEDQDEDGYDSAEERIMAEMREKRILQMKSQQKVDMENLSKGHGVYSEIVEEEFLKVVTKSEFSAVHFYHKDFERCKIVDMHLKEIAHYHPEARFVKLDSEKAPFFIKKLQIQVLPTIVFFKDGVAVDRITGFEEIGGTDDFQTVQLSRRIVKSGIIKAKLKGEDGRMVLRKAKAGDSDSGSDDD